MANKKKETMNQSVFERLAKRFSECQNDYRSGKTLTEWDTSVAHFMFTAGKVLFEAISSEQIRLGDIPSWLRTEPEGIGCDDDGNEIVIQNWDIYWWAAIKWLAKNKRGSGITFSGEIASDINLKQLEGHLHSSEGVETIIMALYRPREKREKRAFFDLAKASEDACLYLANMAGKQKSKETESKTPPVKELPDTVSLTKTELSGFRSVSEIAKFFDIPSEKLRKRLDRERTKHCFDKDLFIESQNRGANKPKFLYNVEKVRPIIDKFIEKRCKKASNKRPTEKN